MIEKLLGAAFGWKGILIGAGLAFLAGNATGAWGGYQVAEAFGSAQTARVELEKAALEKKGLTDRIEDLQATVEVRDEQLRSAGRINLALASASRDVATSIDGLKQAVAEDDQKTPRRVECAYGPAEFQRVQQLVEQARRAGQAERKPGSAAGGP